MLRFSPSSFPPCPASPSLSSCLPAAQLPSPQPPCASLPLPCRLLRQAVGGSSEGFKREGQAHDYARVTNKEDGGSPSPAAPDSIVNGGSDRAREGSPAASSSPGVNGGSGKGGLQMLADARNGVAAAKGASALIKTGRVQ